LLYSRGYSRFLGISIEISVLGVSEGTKVAGFAGEVPSLTWVIAGEGSIGVPTVQAP